MIVVFGTSTLAEIIEPTLVRLGLKILGYINEEADDGHFRGRPVVRSYAEAENVFEGAYRVVVAVGDNNRRMEVSNRLISLGADISAALVDPYAIVESSSSLGNGSVVLPNAYIGPHVEVGDGCFFLPSAVVGHHTTIGSYSWFSPNCSIGGYSKLGERTKISMNSVVDPYLRLDADLVVPALHHYTQNSGSK